MKKIPVIVKREFLGDKNCDYHALMVVSCFGKNSLEKRSVSIDSKYIANMKDDIEETSNKSWITTYKSLVKMSNTYKGLIKVRKVKTNNVYTVSYSGKNNKGYMLVDDNIIKTLLKNKDSSTIKTYLLLKTMCDKESKVISRKYICKHIGLSPKSTTNLDKVSRITDFLQENNLIKKEYTHAEGNSSIKYSII